MPTYIAFLRAINVGGHMVKMENLRALFQARGLRNVETFIASGNVIFDAPAKSTAAKNNPSLNSPTPCWKKRWADQRRCAAQPPFKN